MTEKLTKVNHTQFTSVKIKVKVWGEPMYTEPTTNKEIIDAIKSCREIFLKLLPAYFGFA